MKKFFILYVLALIHLAETKGYGQTTDTLEVLFERVPRKTFVGAQQQLHAADMESTPAIDYLPAVTGRVAGFYTQQNQGFRTMNTNVNYQVDAFLGQRPLAGLGAPSENTMYGIALRKQLPVVVVDGVQRDLFSIDPQSIASITFLKDALSTIALGQRSSRGIMLVTTKRPQAAGTKITFSAQYGLQEAVRLPKPISSYQFAYLLNEALTNRGENPRYSIEDFNSFRAGNDLYRYPNTNWYNEILRANAPIMQYHLGASGGGGSARYAISLSYANQRGLLNEADDVEFNTNASIKRYVLNTNMDIDITKRLSLAMQIMGRVQDGHEPGVGITNLLEVLKKTPNGVYPVKNPNGSWGANDYFKENVLSLATHSGYRQDRMKDIMANIDLRYDLGSWLEGLSVKASTNLAVQSLVGVVRERRDPAYQMAINTDGDTVYAIMSSVRAQSNDFNTAFNSRFWFGRVAADYDRSWDGHHVHATVAADQRRTLFNYDLPAIANNVTARVDYDYNSKYLLQSAVNTSGYNRYRPGYQYGVFYAFGVGWNMAEEDFIKDEWTWLSTLKIRSTFGKTGNGGDNSGYYDYRSTFTPADGRIGSRVYSAGIDRSELRGYWEMGTLPNIRTWEGAYKLNVGIDAAFLNNGLQFTADFYHDRYFDLLQTRGKSIELIGINYPAENIGKNVVKGFETSVKYSGHAGNWRYVIGANLTAEQSKVVYFDEQQQRYVWQQYTGLPVGTRMGYVADGFFQTQEEALEGASTVGYEAQAGDIRYRDLNGDGIINQFDRTAISTARPLVYYGITLGVQYKGLALRGLVQGVKNREVYLDDRHFYGGFMGFGGYEQAYEPILGRWTPETASTATFPRINMDMVNNHNYMESDFWLQSGDYLRLKNLELSYTLSENLWRSRSLKGLRVFVNGLNLLTWSAFKGQDPEVGLGAYPLQRVYNAGVQVNL